MDQVETRTSKKPFFARYLESQEIEQVMAGGKKKKKTGDATPEPPPGTDKEDDATPEPPPDTNGVLTRKYPSDDDEHVTLKYPSDADEPGTYT